MRFGDKTVIRDLSVRIMRADRIGIIGPNGAGKSTLIRLLLGEKAADAGEVRRGTKLQIAYFDQQRAQLDPAATVMQSVGGGSLTVTVNGRSRHVAGYLQDFLFPPQRLQSPVSTLSGGERNRLLLARLFAQPANLLVLDEPTNDLDVETLELLEELLVDYQGTLLLVSHDRAFLDAVVTSTLVLEGDGRVREFVGGYSDWLRQRGDVPAQRDNPAADVRPVQPVAVRTPERQAGKAGRLSYKEQQELKDLPGRIEKLEAEQSRLHTAVGAAGFYQQPGEQIAATLERLESVGKEIEAAYHRWAGLESQVRAAD